MKTQLWFDVEKRYLTTLRRYCLQKQGLWFDVEKRYLTTLSLKRKVRKGCGLMQKRDI